MKKVLALVLAVMMLATVAFAKVKHEVNDEYATKRPVANITPGGSIEIDKNGLKDTGIQEDEVDTTKDKGTWKDMTIIVENEQSKNLLDEPGYSIEAGIFRSITNTNYTIQRVRIDKGNKTLVKGVSINDNEEKIVVDFFDDLDNQTDKTFEVSFKLKGKAKFILRDSDEVVAYNKYCAYTKQLMTIPSDKETEKVVIDEDNQEGIEEYVGKRVTLPDIDFKFIGKVGYGKVQINLGDTNDEEIEDLGAMGVDKERDVVKFANGGTAGTSKRIAGAYTADAILTEEYTDAMTLEARVYAGDVLYFKCSNSPDRDIVGRLADSDADMDFYLFNTNTKYTTLNSNAKLYFNDAEEDDFIYQIKDKKLVPTGTWSEDDDCWVVKTRVLGQYVVSDVELKEFEASAADIAADNNPDTGANDVVGIATALAAVALVSAAAVSLKK